MDEDDKRLVFALTMQRLYQLMEIQKGVSWEYQHQKFNKAAAQIDRVVDKMLQDNILAAVDGTVTLQREYHNEQILAEALTNQQRMLLKDPSTRILRWVERNIRQYNNILANRMAQENISLQSKVEEEYRKRKYKDVSESEAKKLIREKFQEHGRKRARNIVLDALHTNQQCMSYHRALEAGVKYKVWMNGQGKRRVRPWHRAHVVKSVPMEDYFDIYGSFHAQLMYPGDLAGGAENVANCRCWLTYTDKVPSEPGLLKRIINRGRKVFKI